MLKSHPFSGYSNGNVLYVVRKDWLANLASSTQLCKKKYEKSALALLMLRLGTVNQWMTITLNDFAVTGILDGSTNHFTVTSQATN